MPCLLLYVYVGRRCGPSHIVFTGILMGHINYVENMCCVFADINYFFYTVPEDVIGCYLSIVYVIRYIQNNFCIPNLYSDASLDNQFYSKMW